MWFQRTRCTLHDGVWTDYREQGIREFLTLINEESVERHFRSMTLCLTSASVLSRQNDGVTTPLLSSAVCEK